VLNPRQSPSTDSLIKTNPQQRPRVPHVCRFFLFRRRTAWKTGQIIRQGNCWDNAVTETLFASLKVERLHGERFETIRQAKDMVLAWLLWYNRQRMHSTLNYLSPAEFESRWENAGSQAA